MKLRCAPINLITKNMNKTLDISATLKKMAYVSVNFSSR